MSYPSIFEADTLVQNKARLDLLSKEKQPLWGKMNVAQMIAHLNVSYDVSQGKTKVNINPVMRFFLKTFVKKAVVGDRPYAKNGRTAPYFLMVDEKDFENEKKRLLANMQWVFEKGETYFEGRPTGSFGKLTSKEWSNLFQKHLDHHFKQFGV
ncbi:DUF1569 domain-containing protein [Wenyingzhuangia sp. chi5]|uniref:DUF1569 domain-containing protein n=1 Tax=Wenyingzhuangia gilva TaxID=3057677 RepID=A0ABT8VPQ3_9FLAO|nr:DUF1569 domain-containing protein [Wenyingzhuangia sp. chi5]MDO3693949.1 DUF1569 domain-containing protein [Wenyingzhuangia sp. chi5]